MTAEDDFEEAIRKVHAKASQHLTPFQKQAIDAMNEEPPPVKKEKPQPTSEPTKKSEPELTKEEAQRYVQSIRWEEGQRLLALLPQGKGSGLDADKLDGLHADQLLSKAAQMIPPGGGIVGGSIIQVHDNTYHNPNYEEYGEIKGKTVDDAGIGDGKALIYKTASGNIEYDTVSSTLSALTDTTISGAADGQQIVYDSTTSKWVNKDAFWEPNVPNWRRHFNAPFAFYATAATPVSYWNKSSSNPIITQAMIDGTRGPGHPCAIHIKVSGTWYYYVYYTNMNAGAGGFMGIGVARATDPEGPYTALNSGSPIVETQAATDWVNLGNPSVIYDQYDSSNPYKMWFQARPSAAGNSKYFYIEDDNPLFSNVATGAYTDIGIGAASRDYGCSFLRFGQLYYGMICEGASQDLDLYVSHSADSGWTKIYDDVLTRGAAGTWDENGLQYFTLTYIYGNLYCLYSGRDSNGHPVLGTTILQIGLAGQSPYDMGGSAFTKWYAGNQPVLTIGTNPAFDDKYVFSPALQQEVINTGETFYTKYWLWYTGNDRTDNYYQIGVASIP